MSLRLRLVLAAGVAVAAAVLAVAVTAYAGTKAQLQGQLDNSLNSLADRVLGGGPPMGQPRGVGLAPGAGVPPGGDQGHHHGPRPGDGDEGLALDRRAPGFGAAAGIVTLIHRDGTVYVPPSQTRSIPIDSRMRALARSGSGSLFANTTVSGTHLRVLVRGLGTGGAIALALPLGDVDHALSHELLLLLLTAAGGVALAAFLGVLVARTALAPIARFTRAAESIAAKPERLEHERLEVSGEDELARLGTTFNRTLDALEQSLGAQRNLVADASHELRTPIASVRANLQLLRDEALLTAEDREALRRDTIQELDELTSLVADLVELARGSRPPDSTDAVRLDALVEQALTRSRRRSPGLRWAGELEPTLINGDGERMARAVANLLDNAVKWSPPDGEISVNLAGGVLTVTDEGPGFPAEDLPLVFDRFHRARTARAKPGSGLGLAIVRQAAEAHGGWARAENAPQGGAEVSVSFGEPLPLPAQAGAALRA